MSNYKDYTIKARLENHAEVEAILQSLDAEFIGLDKQTDYYYETEIGKLKYRDGNIENLITHYKRDIVDGIERTTVYRYDKNPTDKEINDLKSVKKQIGTTYKERKIYILDNIKIHLDFIPDNKYFIEIEAIDRDNRFTDKELREQCFSLKSRLMISDEMLIKTGYFKDNA